MTERSNDLFGRVSTLDDGARAEGDFYETPAWMVRALIHWRPDLRGRWILEPCVGRGAIADEMRRAGCRVFGNDLDPRFDADWHLDAAEPKLWSLIPKVDAVVSNFPFSEAYRILQHAIATVPTVAVLLRKTFTEPTQERGAWLSEHPPAQVIGLPRHSFRGDSSDSCAADWMIWGRVVGRPIIVDHLAKVRRYAA